MTKEAEQAIRRRLELHSPALFRFDAMRENLIQYADELTEEAVMQRLDRGTGRTTRMMVTALAQLQAGKEVIIKADSNEMEARVFNNFMTMANQLDLDVSKVWLHSTWSKKFHLAEDHPL